MTLSERREGGDRHVLVKGLTLRVDVHGAGEPLLLINGLTRPLDSWETFTREMEGRTVVSFDAPGVGDSPAPALPLSIAALAELAVAVLDDVGFERADVLGISHGGAVAQEFAARSSDRLRGLVLVSTWCGVGATLGTWEALRHFDAPPSAPSVPDVVGAMWQSMAIASWSSIPFLGAITAPSLVVCGSDDDITPPANSRLIAGRIPGAQLVIMPGGHDLQLPEPAAQLARIVTRFLDQLPANREKRHEHHAAAL
jgi:pimeloyl-ACP methyl ester carboxylesterase